MLTTAPVFEYFYSSPTTFDAPVYDPKGGKIEVTVYPDWYERVDLEWDIPDEWGDCTFEIAKAGSPEGPFIDLTPGPIKTNWFVDRHPEQTSKFRKTYYIVKVNRPGGTTSVSQASTWQTKRRDWVELRANEISRREWFLLRKFVGVETYVYKRKTFGKRCPNCWSEKLGLQLKPDCPICFGTSWEGGYFDPIKTRMQYTPVTKTASQTYPGTIESNQITAWTISYPEIDFKDLVYRPADGRVFYVKGMEPTELQARTLKQMMSLEELSKGSIEYELVQKDVEENHE